MGAVFENLTMEELCDLMCGGPEIDVEDDVDESVGYSGHALENLDVQADSDNSGKSV